MGKTKETSLPFKVGDMVLLRNKWIIIRSIYMNDDATLGGSFNFMDDGRDVPPYMAFDDDFSDMRKE